MRGSRRYGPLPDDALPATLQRSSQDAQAIFLKAREEAIQAYGRGDDADRAAYAALKEKFEKRGDQWIAKAGPAA